jgi:hypothetical protein
MVLARRTGARATKWIRGDDWMVHRGFQYIRGHIRYGLRFRGDSRERDLVIEHLWSDSDHGDDKFSTKSTGGTFVELSADVTQLPMDWSIKGHAIPASTARSTPEAELNELDRGVFEHGLPTLLFWQHLMGRDIPMHAHEDNETACVIVRKGYSRRLAYLMAKKERTSIGSLHEVFHGDLESVDPTATHKLLETTSKAMKADLLTKPLDHADHWRHCEGMGLVVLPDAA